MVSYSKTCQADCYLYMVRFEKEPVTVNSSLVKACLSQLRFTGDFSGFTKRPEAEGVCFIC